MGDLNREDDDDMCSHGDGTKILMGKYKLGRFLGKGTFAKVYYAKHIQTGDSVAIKVIDKEQIRRQGLVDQLVREISAMRLVRHPNVVEIREVMATKTRVFFVMEYVRGGELYSKVVNGKIKEDVARMYFQQLISAVDFCHSRGISHRDLKLENVLLDQDGNVKISDFGLSALPEQIRKDGLLHTRCGTPAYVAPEVLRMKGYDGTKADLWSCGVLLYVLLAGFLPFRDENLMKMYCKIFKADFKFPPWISPGAVNIISRLLVTDPEKRITASQIMERPWFKKGLSFPTENESRSSDHVHSGVAGEEDKAPASYNAFELISTMASGFDLSGLFESKKKGGTVFTSRNSGGEIMDRLEKVGRGLGFETTRAKQYTIRLEKRSQFGSKCNLAVMAEVFEVAPDVLLVELNKSSGDSDEYARFCEQDVRTAIKDIVWSWQDI